MPTLRQQLDDLVETLSPDMERAFHAAIADLKDEIVLRELIDRLEHHDIQGALEALHIEAAAFQPLAEAVRTACNSGGALVSSTFPQLFTPQGSRVVFRWDVRNQGAEANIRGLSSTMIPNVSEGTIDAAHQTMVEGYIPAYLAGDKASKVGKNPYIRPSVGGDAANLIFNGYVFDFARYLTNYLSGAQPDIVLIGLGTNDRVFQTDDTIAVADALDGLRVMMTQIRVALPGAKIGWWIPASPRADTIESGAWARQQKIIRSNVAWLQANGDTNMHVIPTWAHISPEVGWWQNASPSAADNVRKSVLGDDIHFGPDPAPLREQCAEVLFAFIANMM